MEVKLSTFLKITFANWYKVIRGTAIAIMLIALLIVGIKAALSSLAEKKSVFKSMLKDWFVGLLVIFFLHYFIYGLVLLNESMVDKCKKWGITLSGINAETSDDEYDEVSLYDSVVSKAYEVKFSSGMLGMIMYIGLVYYTIKFFIIYAKRYINVIILMLSGPIIFLLYSFNKILKGKGGYVRRWTKELIYNIFIQSIHALAYSTLIGLTLKLSDSMLSFIGAIIALIAFSFISKIDSIIRKIFNFVGGNSTVRVRDYAGMVRHPVNTFNDTKDYLTRKGRRIAAIT